MKGYILPLVVGGVTDGRQFLAALSLGKSRHASDVIVPDLTCAVPRSFVCCRRIWCGNWDALPSQVHTLDTAFCKELFRDLVWKPKHLTATAIVLKTFVDWKGSCMRLH